jgi:hypothetical protein
MKEISFSDRIFFFNPYEENKGNYKNRVVYHYTSPDGLLAILRTASIRFTDCEYLNDKSEYNHIHIPMEKAFEEVRNKLYNTELPEMIENYINKGYDYPEIISDKAELGLNGMKFLNMRNFVFCASIDKDSLNMWNYYVKSGTYQGYNIGLSVNDIVNVLFSKIGRHGKLSFGQVIYNDKEKIEILKKIIVKVDKDLYIALQHTKDYEEHDLIVQGHYGELLSFIENCRLFFKDVAFSGEKEYRFVLRLSDDQLMNLSDNLIINYCMKQGIVTPFYDMKFDKSGIIRRIIISPMIEPQLAKSGLQRFLKDNEYNLKLILTTQKFLFVTKGCLLITMFSLQ